MTPAERYVELGLRLGRHVDGLVDAYYGPPELKERVDGEEPAEPARLAADAQALLDEVGDGWLGDQVHGLATYARVLAGERLSYSDEVEGCYGVRPQRTPLEVYERAHAELDELLPPGGTLTERRLGWRQRQQCDGAAAVQALRDLVPLLRERTRAVVELPEGERVEVEAVEDAPWWAFNYYLGDLASRVVLNTGYPTSADDLVHLAAHEIYPGHHTEHAVKEQRLLRDRGLLEESIQLVPTPQAVLSEGIAEVGAEVVLDDDAKERAAATIRARGIELTDPALSERIAKALEPLRTVAVNAAIRIHEDGATIEEAQEYVQRWNLVSPELAAHSVRFVTDPAWRAYAITYSAGRDLCRAYVGGDPARFGRLLTDHVRIGELLSATRPTSHPGP